MDIAKISKISTVRTNRFLRFILSVVITVASFMMFFYKKRAGIHGFATTPTRNIVFLMIYLTCTVRFLGKIRRIFVGHVHSQSCHFDCIISISYFPQNVNMHYRFLFYLYVFRQLSSMIYQKKPTSSFELVGFFRFLILRVPLLALAHALGQKIFDLTVYRAEFILRPGGELTVELCGKPQGDLFFVALILHASLPAINKCYRN